MLPVFFPCFVVVLHDAIVNGFPRRQDITLDAVLLGMWYSFQEEHFIGNRVEKFSMKGLLELVNIVSVKDLEATSAILLSFPALWMVCIGAARCI